MTPTCKSSKTKWKTRSRLRLWDLTWTYSLLVQQTNYLLFRIFREYKAKDVIWMVAILMCQQELRDRTLLRRVSQWCRPFLPRLKKLRWNPLTVAPTLRTTPFKCKWTPWIIKTLIPRSTKNLLLNNWTIFLIPMASETHSTEDPKMLEEVMFNALPFRISLRQCMIILPH